MEKEYEVDQESCGIKQEYWMGSARSTEGMEVAEKSRRKQYIIWVKKTESKEKFFSK